KKNGIRVNTIAPIAATRMTEDIFTPELLEAVRPEQVAAGALFLVSEDAPSNIVLSAGGGSFSAARIVDTAPVWLGAQECTPEGVAAHFDRITDWSTERAYESSNHQVQALMAEALANLKATA